MRTIVETSKGYVLVDSYDTGDELWTAVFKCKEDGEVMSWRRLDSKRYMTIARSIQERGIDDDYQICKIRELGEEPEESNCWKNP